LRTGGKSAEKRININNESMKAAIYSRVVDDEQRKDLQSFFDELAAQQIEPVLFLDFFEQVKDIILLPPDTKTFSSADDLTEENGNKANNPKRNG
jgi:hypothetical protein